MLRGEVRFYLQVAEETENRRDRDTYEKFYSMSKNGTQYYEEDKECNCPHYFLVLFVQVFVEVNQLSEYAFGLGFLGQIYSVGPAWLPKKLLRTTVLVIAFPLQYSHTPYT